MPPKPSLIMPPQLGVGESDAIQRKESDCPGLPRVRAGGPDKQECSLVWETGVMCEARSGVARLGRDLRPQNG